MNFGELILPKNAETLNFRQKTLWPKTFISFFFHSVSTAWATHPEMFAYLPSNITKHNSHHVFMGAAGATITYNTDELKHGIMKWAFSCAMTIECLAPNYQLTEKHIPWGEWANPWGDFDIHYCNNTYEKFRPGACHRFDQSMFSILVYNHYNFDQEKFRIFGTRKDFLGIADRSLGAQIKENYKVYAEKTGTLPMRAPHPPPERLWKQDIVDSDAYRGPNRGKEELAHLEVEL